MLLRSTDDVRKIWAAMRAQSSVVPIYRSLEQNDRLQIGLYCNGKNQIGLAVYSDTPLPKRFSYSNLQIKTIRCSNGQWQILLLLLTPELEVPFAMLVAQILSGASKDAQKGGGHYIAQYLTRWNALLRRQGDLSAETERGLWSELEILQRVLERHNHEAALKAWMGPEGTPQDFYLNDSALEIKTLFDRSGEIKISSLDQLDPPTQSLYLVVVSLELDITGSNLREKVSHVREILTEEPEQLSVFNEKLRWVGYDEETDKVGSKQKYSAFETTWYDAADLHFPCLRKDNVAPGIIKVSYSIAVDALKPFKTEELF